MQRKKSLFPLVFAVLTAFALLIGTLDVFVYAKYIRGGRLYKLRHPAEKVDMTDPDGNTDYGRIYYSPVDEEHIVEYEDASGCDYIDNEVLVVANDGVSREQIAELAAKYDAEIVGEIEVSGDYQLRLTTTPDGLDSVIESISAEPAVASAYPNYVAAMSEENGDIGDFYFGNEWNNELRGHNTLVKSWGFAEINTPAAWIELSDHSDVVNPVKVGVCDGGFSDTHVDLNYAEIFHDDSLWSNSTEHGTHVSGTIAANADNEIGICGVYPYGKNNLYAVKVSGANSFFDTESFFTSIMCEKVSFGELIIRNVKVINFSQGFNHYINKFKNSDGSIDRTALTAFWNNPASHTEMMKQSSALGDFFNRMIDKNYDFVLVAAAGNDSSKKTSHPIAKYGSHLEARYNSPLCMIEQAEYPRVYDRIIVVGALEIKNDPTSGIPKLEIADYSNGGVRNDIYAPGSDIYSTFPGDSYDTMSGTSIAAPHVTGVAAMVWSANNGLTGAEVKDIICDNTMPSISEFKMLDANGSVCAALGTPNRFIRFDRTEGAAYGYVQIKGITNIKISDANVTLTDVEHDDEFHTYTGKTDLNGHYEIFAPEGEYNIKVTADGYSSYESKKPIKIYSNEITYLDKIKLKKLKIKSSGGGSGKTETTTESAKETPEIGKIYTGEDIKKFLPDKFGKFDIGIGLDKIRAWTYYEGHYYAIFDHAMSARVMSLATQQDPDVHLVTITSDKEQQLIEELMLYGDRDVYYTGGMVDSDGDVYTVNGEDTDYTNWYEGYPQNYGKEGYDDIIAVYRGSGDDPKSDPDYGIWFDFPENDISYLDFTDIDISDVTRGIVIEWEDAESEETTE